MEHLQIGSHANLVALTFFDEDPSKQWHLTDFGNKHDLLNAISKVNPSKSHDSNEDLDEMAEWVVETALDNHHGDRKGFPNDVIIITAASNEYDDDHHLLRRIHHASGDVILVEVGTGSNHVDADKRIEQLATNSGHVIKVPSYSQLPRITTHLLKLLCS